VFIPATYWMMHGLRFNAGSAGPAWWKFYLCALIGLGITGLLFVITDYYTSTRFGPVKRTARASQTGHATNIIQAWPPASRHRRPGAGPRPGHPGLLEAGRRRYTGIYGIGVAVMAQLSLMG